MICTRIAKITMPEEKYFSVTCYAWNSLLLDNDVVNIVLSIQDLFISRVHTSYALRNGRW